jgi:hypothetical protein
MHCLSILAGLAFCLYKVSAWPISPHNNTCTPSAFEGLSEAEHLTALLLDTKNYDALGHVFTDDIYYDSRSLGPIYGGLSTNLKEIKAAVKQAFDGAKVEHIVSNLYIKELLTPTKAHTNT